MYILYLLYVCEQFVVKGFIAGLPVNIDWNCATLQGVMVRLMLVLAPVMCILSAIGVSGILTTYMKNIENPNKKDKKPKRADLTYPLKHEVRGVINFSKGPNFKNYYNLKYVVVTYE